MNTIKDALVVGLWFAACLVITVYESRVAQPSDVER